jgi:hypothetical protein
MMATGGMMKQAIQLHHKTFTITVQAATQAFPIGTFTAN